MRVVAFSTVERSSAPIRNGTAILAFGAAIRWGTFGDAGAILAFFALITRTAADRSSAAIVCIAARNFEIIARLGRTFNRGLYALATLTNQFAFAVSAADGSPAAIVGIAA